jgi:hypothetical protein
MSGYSIGQHLRGERITGYGRDFAKGAFVEGMFVRYAGSQERAVILELDDGDRVIVLTSTVREIPTYVPGEPMRLRDVKAWIERALEAGADLESWVLAAEKNDSRTIHGLTLL